MNVIADINKQRSCTQKQPAAYATGCNVFNNPRYEAIRVLFPEGTLCMLSE